MNNKINKIIIISPYKPTPHANNVINKAINTNSFPGLIKANIGQLNHFLNPLL